MMVVNENTGSVRARLVTFEHNIRCARYELTVFASGLYHRSLRSTPYKIVPLPERQTEAEALIKLDIINRVADKTGVPKMKAEQAVDALFPLDERGPDARRAD